MEQRELRRAGPSGIKKQQAGIARRRSLAAWPRYLVEKRLTNGGTTYYWRPKNSDIAAKCPVLAEALGTDLEAARARAEYLNEHLDAWRGGLNAVKDIDLHPGVGSLYWLIERYKGSPAWEKVSRRSRPEYQRAFDLVCGLRRKSGGEIGHTLVSQFDAAAVDKIYKLLQTGKRGKRLRQANLCINRVARAWDVVRRLKPNLVPKENPWRGVEIVHSKGKKPAATRDQALALHKALIAAGEPYLAAVPLVCFEWVQRPENVLDGHLAWTDYRPDNHPNMVRILHHKTGVSVWKHIADEDGMFFPELSEYLETLKRLGVPIVLMQPQRGSRGKPPTPRLFKHRDARDRVRAAARAAKLPDWLTLDACRHGGLTELGDAGCTESEEMAASGHQTPDAKRRYVKKTEAQALAAARRRRQWRLEQKHPKVGMPTKAESRNETDKRR